jgi:XRE family transcriptional regulator, aerobic/anaerobic benzoate catabolism transcriptional regulator
MTSISVSGEGVGGAGGAIKLVEPLEPLEPLDPLDPADPADRTALEGATEVLAQVGGRVRELRRRRGWTQLELGRASGVSVRFLGQLEAGSGNISLGRLALVARALGATMAELLTLDPAGGGGAREVGQAGQAVTRGVSSSQRAEDGPAELLAELLRQRGPAEVARALELARSLLEVSPGVRVALLGIRGAGKTTVGARLAERLGVPFVELDALVEQLAGLPLASVFELHGEGYYRRLEQQALLSLLARPSFVVATGGSIVTSPDRYALLRRACRTVWLKARPEDHWERVLAQGDGRPMRENPRAMDELRALFESRSPLYAQAHLTVDTGGAGVDEVVAKIEGVLRRAVVGPADSVE